eukprot:1199688-Prymnesium_polylepis.1
MHALSWQHDTLCSLDTTCAHDTTDASTSTRTGYTHTVTDKRQGKEGWVLLLRLAGDTRGLTLARHASVLLWHGSTK